MARFHLLPVGVFDNDTGKRVLPGEPEWDAVWLPWFLAGNAPDPIPPRVVTAEDLAQEQDIAERKAARAALRVDSTIDFLRTHTPAECAAWVQTNVTDLATAKNVLAKLAMICAYLARERLSGADQ